MEDTMNMYIAVFTKDTINMYITVFTKDTMNMYIAVFTKDTMNMYIAVFTKDTINMYITVFTKFELDYNIDQQQQQRKKRDWHQICVPTCKTSDNLSNLETRIGVGKQPYFVQLGILMHTQMVIKPNVWGLGLYHAMFMD